MAMDEKRRQKKLARKAAKRKKNLIAKRTLPGPSLFGSPEKQVAFVAGMPIQGEGDVPEIMNSFCFCRIKEMT